MTTKDRVNPGVLIERLAEEVDAAKLAYARGHLGQARYYLSSARGTSRQLEQADELAGILTSEQRDELYLSNGLYRLYWLKLLTVVMTRNAKSLLTGRDLSCRSLRKLHRSWRERRRVYERLCHTEDADSPLFKRARRIYRGGTKANREDDRQFPLVP